MYSSFKNTSFIAPDNFLYKITDLVGAGDIIDRSIAENNQLLTQLVSYTLILNPKSKKIFIAQRISGDERLQNSFCLGFGGHVSIEDFSLQFGSDPIRNLSPDRLVNPISFFKIRVNFLKTVQQGRLVFFF